MPVSGWNGKLQVVGNGGFAGTISYPAMANALAAGGTFNSRSFSGAIVTLSRGRCGSRSGSP